MRRALKPFVVILVVFSFFVASVAPSPIESQNLCDWLMFGRTPDGKRNVESGCGLSSTQLCKLWETRFQVDNLAPPVVWQNNLYQSDNGNLYCINLEDRSVKWSYETEQCENYSHVIDSERMYFVNYHIRRRECRVICLNATNGKFIWEYLTKNDSVNYPLAIFQHMVYASYGKGNLVCLDGSSGNGLWTHKSQFTPVPVFGDNHVYLPGIICLDATTGKVVWDKDKDYIVLSTVAVDNDKLYSVTNGDNSDYDISCLQASTGELIWKSTWGGYREPESIRSLFIADNKLYMLRQKHESIKNPNGIICFDLETKKILWSLDTGNHMLNFPTFDNGNIIVGSDFGLIMFIDMNTGKIVQTYNIGQPIGYELVVASKKLFIPTRKSLLCYEDDL